MTTQTFEGQLEIDNERGVIYFHDNATGGTKLRICNLPTPIPVNAALDITHLINCDWQGEVRIISLTAEKENEMSVLTRAEEKNREAVEHLSVAIKAISEIVVEQCDG